MNSNNQMNNQNTGNISEKHWTKINLGSFITFTFWILIIRRQTWAEHLRHVIEPRYSFKSRVKSASGASELNFSSAGRLLVYAFIFLAYTSGIVFTVCGKFDTAPTKHHGRKAKKKNPSRVSLRPPQTGDQLTWWAGFGGLILIKKVKITRIWSLTCQKHQMEDGNRSFRLLIRVITDEWPMQVNALLMPGLLILWHLTTSACAHCENSAHS